MSTVRLEKSPDLTTEASMPEKELIVDMRPVLLASGRTFRDLLDALPLPVNDSEKTVLDALVSGEMCMKVRGKLVYVKVELDELGYSATGYRCWYEVGYQFSANPYG